ncbi:uncharacterized protein LOC141902301 [Tubulanus polymorphus]|uniref:uncharacterized protein LOC141902301 n=1 Tax=Tubulanus polymorphus TaxID=672921 RepID=UPI003DA2DE43
MERVLEDDNELFEIESVSGDDMEDDNYPSGSDDNRFSASDGDDESEYEPGAASGNGTESEDAPETDSEDEIDPDSHGDGPPQNKRVALMIRKEKQRQTPKKVVEKNGNGCTLT